MRRLSESIGGHLISPTLLTAPKLVRNALLSFLLEAAEVTRASILYVGHDELEVSPRDLAFMFCIAERHNLDFERGGIVDAEGSLSSGANNY